MEAKKYGQYFTPRHVAEFMVGLSSMGSSASVLEPSAGKGIFLQVLQEKGHKDIVGYEIDKSLKNKGNTPIIYKSFVKERFTNKFDLVIGNPPYIRWKNLDKDLKSELGDNQLWQRYFNSLSDYLYIFILKSVELLKQNGELIFITPEYWLNTKHAQSLRDYLVSQGYFKEIIHFNETPIFDKVASSIVIFRYIKSPGRHNQSKEIKLIKHHSSKKLSGEDLNLIKKYLNGGPRSPVLLRPQFSKGERWILASDDIDAQLKEYEDKCSVTVGSSLFGDVKKYSTLGDISEIGNGMVSGLDKAFRLPADLKLNKNEKKSTINVLKAKNISQYSHGEYDRYIFLDDTVSEAELASDYPNFYSHLLPFKDRLNKRYNYSRDLNYWTWAFKRNYKLFSNDKDKIFIPGKERISHKSYFRFCYVNSNVFPTQDVTAIVLNDEIKESIFYILALLNSDVVFNWLKHKGVVKGNIVEFSEKPLASLPLRLIDWANKTEVGIHNQISQAVEEYIKTSNVKYLAAAEESLATLL